MSAPLRPAEATRTRTWPAPGSGSGCSATSRTPPSLMVTALTGAAAYAPADRYLGLKPSHWNPDMNVMRLPSLLLLVVLAASLAVGAAPASATLSSAETVYLDAFDPANDGDAGPVSPSDVLAPGVLYMADVSGAFSPFNATVWAFHNAAYCGTVEPAAITPSPGGVDTVVGQDAETRFGIPWKWRCPSLPQHGGGFQIDAGSGFTHPPTTDGVLSTPNADHRYSYPLVGQGQPARFRIIDNPTADDNGILTITVRQASESGQAPVAAAPGTAAANTTASAGAT